MPQMQGNALEISLDFQLGPTPAIFSAHAPADTAHRNSPVCIGIQIVYCEMAADNRLLTQLLGLRFSLDRSVCVSVCVCVRPCVELSWVGTFVSGAKSLKTATMAPGGVAESWCFSSVSAETGTSFFNWRLNVCVCWGTGCVSSSGWSWCDYERLVGWIPATWYDVVDRNE